MITDSNREFDDFGYLTVENCILTGEDVAPYFGYEIPGYKELGLDEKKIYFVYRPEEEIKDSNFSNRPLLSKHADFSAEDYKYKLVVGTVGETRMEDGQKKGTIVFWDKRATDSLEKGLKYLSCGYMYEPVVEKGFYNNIAYDIKMVNIVANHVAMVDNPRYKRAIVADEQSQGKDEKMIFSKKKPLLTQDKEWDFDTAMDAMKDCMASDEEGEEKNKKLESIKDEMRKHLLPRGVKDSSKAKDKKDEEMSRKEAKEEGAMDKKDEELKDKEQKEDEDEEGKEASGKDKKMAKDADIKRLVADSVAREIEKITRKTLAFDSACKEYERVCGRLNRTAFDSAEKVLDIILKNSRITFDGKSFEQKQAMVEMLPSLKSTDSSRIVLTVDSLGASKNHTPANILDYLKRRF